MELPAGWLAGIAVLAAACGMACAAALLAVTARARQRRELRDIVTALEEIRTGKTRSRVELDPASELALVADAVNRLGHDVGARLQQAEHADEGLRAILDAAQGGSRTFRSPYYISSNSLKAGLHDYHYSLGFRREALGQKSFDYSDLTAVLFHKYGFSDSFTGAVGAEGTKDVVAGGVGAILRVPGRENWRGSWGGATATGGSVTVWVRGTPMRSERVHQRLVPARLGQVRQQLPVRRGGQSEAGCEHLRGVQSVGNRFPYGQLHGKGEPFRFAERQHLPRLFPEPLLIRGPIPAVVTDQGGHPDGHVPRGDQHTVRRSLRPAGLLHQGRGNEGIALRAKISSARTRIRIPGRHRVYRPGRRANS